MNRYRDIVGPYGDTSEPDDQILAEYIPEIHGVIKEKWRMIKSKLFVNKFSNQYQFRLKTATKTELKELLKYVFNLQTEQFKLTLSFGYILKHNTTKDYRYFHPSGNVCIRSEPKLIQSYKDIEEYMEIIDETDLLEYAKRQRPDSRYIPVAVINVVMTLYTLKKPIR